MKGYEIISWQINKLHDSLSLTEIHITISVPSLLRFSFLLLSLFPFQLPFLSFVNFPFCDFPLEENLSFYGFIVSLGIKSILHIWSDSPLLYYKPSSKSISNRHNLNSFRITYILLLIKWDKFLTYKKNLLFNEFLLYHITFIFLNIFNHKLL
jgi:hypothetical protein